MVSTDRKPSIWDAPLGVSAGDPKKFVPPRDGEVKAFRGTPTGVEHLVVRNVGQVYSIGRRSVGVSYELRIEKPRPV